MVFKKGKR